MNLIDRIASLIDDGYIGFKTLQKIIAILCILIPLVLRLSDHDHFDRQTLHAQGLNYIGDSSLVKKIALGNKYHDSSIVCYTKNVDNTPVATYAPNIKDPLGFRQSISHYASASNSYVYGLLYGITAMLFITNGFIYHKLKVDSNKTLDLLSHNEKKTFPLNIIIGVLLILIVFFPLDSIEWFHYLLAVAFFSANIYAVLFLRNESEKPTSKLVRFLIAGVALISLVISLVIYYWFPNTRYSAFSILWGEWFSLTAIAIHLFLIAGAIQANETKSIK